MALWHTVTVIISAANFIFGALLFFGLFQKKTEPENAKYSLLLRILGLVFIAVALYRSNFVTSYQNRLAWYDTLFNSPFFIRCLAFCAELSFNGMIAAILLKMGKEMNPAGDRKLARAAEKLPIAGFACIFIAQFFAYASLIAQYKTALAIEETLWALAFFCYVPLVAMGLRQAKKQPAAFKGYQAFLIVMAVWCAGYLVFQCFGALPLHYAHISQDVGLVVPSDALRTAIFGFTKTRDFAVWGGTGFFIWHTGYFSLCSWMALLFMTAPRLRHNLLPIDKAAGPPYNGS